MITLKKLKDHIIETSKDVDAEVAEGAMRPLYDKFGIAPNGWFTIRMFLALFLMEMSEGRGADDMGANMSVLVPLLCGLNDESLETTLYDPKAGTYMKAKKELEL